MRIQAHLDDIRSIFSHRLEKKSQAQRRIMTRELQDQIVDTIASRAQGMYVCYCYFPCSRFGFYSPQFSKPIILRGTERFLWASLQIDKVLKQITKAAVLKTLKNMPSTIYGSRTSFAALSHALSIELEDPPTQDVDKDNIETVVEACRGLVVVEGDETLRLVHFTVQEYFGKNPQKLDEMYIARVCLTYLSLQVFESGYRNGKQTFHQRLLQYPLLPYAAKRWCSHVAGEVPSEIEDAVVDLYCNRGKFSSYCQAYHFNGDPRNGFLPFQFPPIYSPLHNAVELHLLGVARRLLGKGWNTSSQTITRPTPLHLAVKSGRKAMVDLLLSAGANKFYRGADPSKCGTNGTLLIAAASRGLEELFTLLLDRGADVNGINDEIVKLLLYHDVDPDVSGKDLPLNHAIDNGDDKIVKLLLDHGADPNARNSLQAYALETATECGNRKLVRLLLDRGADLHARGGMCGSLLHAAARSSHPGMVQFMLDLGSKVFEDDEKFGGVLHLAKLKDYPLLVRHGANVNAKGGTCGYPLQTAVANQGSEEQKLEAVKFLIQAGAEINAVGGCFNTALEAACFLGLEKVVALLLEEGALLTPKSYKGGSPPITAARVGRGFVVETLLKHGAQVNQQDGRHGTAIHAATRGGHDAVVKEAETTIP
ncbi:uncharacterized protein Z518_10055 [Rhinocladiella mackenziei CBS 650.93]|uniref:Uncharacterized protein n=1 Tax=Rhinocladiella mackenziei CBS 650.93 TaxID=1442369 RepID=A0A0D2I5B0_9EURO|nr:uncharacterized protein Z518_10055 [Rhinocladiella mackenziei CBS 650.93]KIX00989.1 hypothetical protein Z518_10055 [Rhinocladiella mackenziei CBS 650.93]